MDKTVEFQGPPEEPSAAALALLGGLRPGRFRTTIGFDAYKMWVEGQISDEQIQEAVGFCG